MADFTHRTTETGQLEEPKFVRGVDPTKSVWRPPPRRSKWQKHYELLRNNPGQWALVAEVKKGGPKASMASIRGDRRAFEFPLRRYYPLERWQLRVVTVPGTWNHRELYARFIGVLTQEEHERDWVERRALYNARMARAKENKARKAAEARAKAEREEAESQVRIRARRKPGQ